ncbi:hypothetical protein C8R43DRAFT_1141937 [Mycena crocata]|nr:hypothetical protein C8R43DRAFT_1141937 [Mycena crocata]
MDPDPPVRHIPQKRVAEADTSNPAPKVRLVRATEGEAQELIEQLREANHSLKQQIYESHLKSVEVVAVWETEYNNISNQLNLAQLSLEEWDLQAQQEDSPEDVAMLKAELDRLRFDLERIDILEAENEELEDEKERLCAENKKLQTDSPLISELQERLEVQQTLFGNNREEIQAANAKISSLQSSNADLRLQMEALQGKNNYFAQEGRKLEASLESLQMTMAADIEKQRPNPNRWLAKSYSFLQWESKPLQDNPKVSLFLSSRHVAIIGHVQVMEFVSAEVERRSADNRKLVSEYERQRTILQWTTELFNDVKKDLIQSNNVGNSLREKLMQTNQRYEALRSEHSKSASHSSSSGGTANGGPSPASNQPPAAPEPGAGRPPISSPSPGQSTPSDSQTPPPRPPPATPQPAGVSNQPPAAHKPGADRPPISPGQPAPLDSPTTPPRPSATTPQPAGGGGTSTPSFSPGSFPSDSQGQRKTGPVNSISKTQTLNRVREIATKKLGIKADNDFDNLTLATEEDEMGCADGTVMPDPKAEKLSFYRGPVQGHWNNAVGELVVLEFFKKYPDTDVLPETVRQHWQARLRAIKGELNRHDKSKASPEYAEKVEAVKRRGNDRAHLFARRHNAALHHLMPEATLKDMAVVFKRTSAKCMSSDEEAGPRSKVKHKGRGTAKTIVEGKDWRASGLISIYKWADLQAKRLGFNSSGRIGRGNEPHKRIRHSAAKRPVSKAKAIAGLPLNYYNPLYLNSLTPAARDGLKLQPEIPLPTYVLHWPENSVLEPFTDDDDEYWHPPPKQSTSASTN